MFVLTCRHAYSALWSFFPKRSKLQKIGSIIIIDTIIAITTIISNRSKGSKWSISEKNSLMTKIGFLDKYLVGNL